MTRKLFLGLLLTLFGLPMMDVIAPEVGRAVSLQAQDEAAEESEKDAADEKVEKSAVAKQLGAFKFRSIGPAMMSGRIADIAIDQEKPNTWYVAAGSGGLWKTTSAGTTWKSIFDKYASWSIGCVTIDPNNRHTIWVGTGENVAGRHVGFGDGVYVSHDGGASFKNVGLKKTEHISKIIVDPRDSKVVYVAAQGPLWSKGGERGLYKTTDGGKTWKLVLEKNEWTGVTDIAIDHTNPDVIYAATHQRHRTVAALVDGGPDSGIFKSTDGGATWKELKKGLPGGDKGKMCIAVSPQRANVLYAGIELPNKKGGFYRSENFGESWTKMSDYVAGGTGPHYYQEIWADPHRFDCVYHANVRLGRTEDGGKTWQNVETRTKHVDNHAVAFAQNDPDFVAVGCDGGLYKSYDRGQTYDFTENLPLTQFYKVDVDYDWPIYHVVGGTQDNNTQYGPSRTLNRTGIRNADWKVILGGDGHDCAIAPYDSSIVYCESQQGYLSRFDRKTGQTVSIRPQPEKGETSLRFNWDSPIHISPHKRGRIYFGSKKLHRSDDQGDSWTSVSGDLSRNRDRLKMKMMEKFWGVEAIWDLYAMSDFGNITSISESPVIEGLIYVGTDDGLIHVTEDGGQNWRRIDSLPGVPEFFFVNDIKADRHDSNIAYACIDDHKTGDFKPYVLKTEDRGQTWKLITDGLPDRHLTWRINQDHVNPNLLFLGTEFGVFTSFNGGEKWHKMSAGLPNISVRDIEIQRRENDIVVATFGRGIYILDDYAPLRELSEEMLEKDFVMFPTRKALAYSPTRGGSGSAGSSFYAAPNPDFGAVFRYYLKDVPKTQKQKREEAEKEKKRKDGTPYPGWDVIKKESQEQGPKVFLEIRDFKGRIVNRIDGVAKKGINKVTWNLRRADEGSGRTRGSSMVATDSYEVTAFLMFEGEIKKLGEPTTFDVVELHQPTILRVPADEIVAYKKELATFGETLSAMNSKLADAKAQMTEVAGLVQGNVKVPMSLLAEIRALELKLIAATEKLSGDPTPNKFKSSGNPSIQSRFGNARGGAFSAHGPTTTHRQQFAIAKEEFAAVESEIRTLLEKDVPALMKKLDDSGLPWSKGRPMPASTGK
jgi:photosystem II stability/assembly factor-like uncharacterized protein